MPCETMIASRGQQDGPVLRLTRNWTTMSGVNLDCEPYLTMITREEAKRLGLQQLDKGDSWALMTLHVSSTSEWSFCVRYSARSRHNENRLCVQQALARGAVICARDANPTIGLSGLVFALQRRATPRHAATQLESLCLRLPLEPAEPGVAAPGRAAFWPRTHGLHYTTINRSVATEILGLANLTLADMDQYVTGHGDGEGEPPPWLLGDLTRVSHPTHLAYTLELAMRDDLSTGDNSETMYHVEEDMTVTTFFLGAPLPRIWASLPGTGTAPVGAHGVHDELMQSPRDALLRSLAPAPAQRWSTSWWVRAWGFVDSAASRCYLSRTHAERLNLDLDSTTTSVAASLS